MTKKEYTESQLSNLKNFDWWNITFQVKTEENRTKHITLTVEAAEALLEWTKKQNLTEANRNE